LLPENHVNWTQTPEAHVYFADLPGVRKEEIKVEVEDSRCLIIRTEAIDDSTKPATDLKRKFRLPGSIDTDGISTKYEDGVLTVTVPVPMTFRRCSFNIDPADVPDRVEFNSENLGNLFAPKIDPKDERLNLVWTMAPVILKLQYFPGNKHPGSADVFMGMGLT
ncbi:hypothetical protein Goari_009047, partial [Gossypium aridum]|nr:hypothetical protein [Gossypium aridum]